MPDQLTPGVRIQGSEIFDLASSWRGHRIDKMGNALGANGSGSSSPACVQRIHRNDYAPMATGMGLITLFDAN